MDSFIDISLQKCIRDGCFYYKHKDVLNPTHGDYCCKGCKISGNHGHLCKKRSILNTAVQGIFDIDSISVYIFNWHKVSENSLKLYRHISEVVNDVTIINCDETLKLNNTIKNIQLDDSHFYGSQYQHAITDVKENKILCVIVGDNIAENSFKDIFMNALQIFNKYKVGVYGPYDKRSGIEGKLSMLEKGVFNVHHTDCGFWFINPEIVKVFKNYNFKELTNYGWGIDLITANESLRLGYKVILDHRSTTDQLNWSTNYNWVDAGKQMEKLLHIYNKNNK